MVWPMASDDETSPSPSRAEGGSEKKNGLTKTLSNSSSGSGSAHVGLYEFDRPLGKGSFAVVHLAKHQLTKSEVAVKIIDKQRLDEDGSRRVQREVQTLKQVSHGHPNVLRLYQVLDLAQNLYIITEFCARGDLFDLVSKRGRIEESHARHIFRQITSAVEYLHSQHIAHRDLKAENILLTTQGQVKIADFGFSTSFQEGEKLRLWCGSPPYAAPEMFLGHEYSGPAADIWSLGVLLYVMVCGALPFEGTTVGEIRARVLQGRYRIPFFLSTDCEQLLKRMMTVDQTRRITIEAVQRHVWCMPASSTAQPALPEAPADGAEFPRQRLGAMSFHSRGSKDASDEQHHGLRVLRILKEFGIDVQATVKSVRSKSFDHHHAIYQLFVEKLRRHDQVVSSQQAQCRQSPASDGPRAEKPTVEFTRKSTDSMSSGSSDEAPVPMWQPLPRPPDIQIHTVDGQDVRDSHADGYSSLPGRGRGRSSTSTIPRTPMYDGSPCDNGPLLTTGALNDAASTLAYFEIGRRASDGAALHGEAVAFRQRLRPLQVHEARTFTSSVIAEEPMELAGSPMDVSRPT